MRERTTAVDSSWSSVADDMSTLGVQLEWGGERRGADASGADEAGVSWCLRGQGTATHQDRDSALDDQITLGESD